MIALKVIYNFIVFPGLLFSSVLGLVTTWLDRKIGARVQWRVGPPWYQPFADFIKLLGKQIMFPEGAYIPMFILSPMIGLAGALLVSTMLWVTNLGGGAAFIGDLIVAVYLLAIPSVAVILGGFASANPLAATGSSREMKLILAYELPFVIAVFTVVAKAGSLVLWDIIKYQQVHGMLISQPSCVAAALVALLVSQAKLALVPFDMPEAEQELAGGSVIEYSGALLALFKLTKAIMFSVLPVFLITLFFGGIDLSTTSGAGYFALKYILIVLLMTVIRNTNPRLRIDQAVRVFWGPVTALAVLGFVLAMFGV